VTRLPRSTGPVPSFEPMLATPWPSAFSDPDWAFEPKWDGVRILARCGEQRLISRSGHDVTDSYPELARLGMLGDLVLDGEVVAFGADGRPSFELLQQRINVHGRRRVNDLAQNVPIHYLVFDVLFDDGPIVDRPWQVRRRRLDELALPAPAIASSAVEEAGEAMFAASAGQGLEGIVAKRRASPYRPGSRSLDWRKIVHIRRTRAVVGGFTPGEGARRDGFGALLLGLWDGPLLRFCGAVGTGFDHASLRAIRAALDEMGADHTPFHPDPAIPADQRPVHPHLVAEIAFKQWTSAGRLRAPSFKGFSERHHDQVTWDEDGPDAAGLFDDG